MDDSQVAKSPIAQLKDLLHLFTEEELVEANKVIVDRIKLIRKSKAIDTISNFHVGDFVTFKNGNKTMLGVVARLNHKTISVATENGKWNVSPQLLTKSKKKFQLKF